MALTAAERQKRYRDRMEYRVNTSLNILAGHTLDALCHHFSLGKKAMLEKMIEEYALEVVGSKMSVDEYQKMMNFRKTNK